MSELRDVRLLIAKELNVSRSVKAALIDMMNIFDAALDAEGWQAPTELTDAVRRLDKAIIQDDDEAVEMEDQFIDEDDDFVDIEDIVVAEDTDDDEEEDEV